MFLSSGQWVFGSVAEVKEFFKRYLLGSRSPPRYDGDTTDSNLSFLASMPRSSVLETQVKSFLITRYLTRDQSRGSENNFSQKQRGG
jgi:hypothetical protein